MVNQLSVQCTQNLSPKERKNTVFMSLSPQSPLSPSFHQQSPKEKEEWISLEGYLFMKCQTGALTFLQSKKKLYFGLVEVENKLIYYRDKADFDRRRDCLGTISLSNAVCSIVEGNLCAFVLHTGGKKYVLEAENERCCDCWLTALQQRRDILDDLQEEDIVDSEGNQPHLVAIGSSRRFRSRSRTLQSESDSHHSRSEESPVRPRLRSHFYGKRPNLPPLRLEIDSNGTAKHIGRSLTLCSFPLTPLTAPVGACAETLPSTATIATAPPILASSQSKDDLCVERGGGLLRKFSKTTRSHSEAPSFNVDQYPQGEFPLPGSASNETRSREFTCCPNGCSQQQAWTDAWINNWLYDHVNQQTSQKLESGPSEPNMESYYQHSANASSSPVMADPLESPGLEASDDSHTSQCDSARTSVASSSPVGDELTMLRAMGNRQKLKIQELSMECTNLANEVQRLRKLNEPKSNGSVCNGLDHTTSIAAQNRFLNAELLRINDRCQASDKQIEACKKKILKLHGEMEDFKKEYVFVLQSCVRIPLRDNSSCDVVQVKLFGGDVHEKRVKKLLERARESDPTLPTFESVTKPGSCHVDDYGFRHTFEDMGLALHYIATQLNEHYASQSDDYIVLKRRWRAILDTNPERIEVNSENRHLCRAGIPRSLRSRVWKLLIEQQVADLKTKYGPYYYRNLCSSQGTPAEKHYCTNHQKQVNLDLLRTMPANVHFMSASCKGVTHLQTVLRAYCLHNPNIGYCQGMNFLVSTALLFVSPEDAFWFLVAITERYFDPSYFDQSLTGAQADQEVLKEIVEQKFPKLASHLYECDIDLTTITLNWFIALFFDAVPFQTMLRLWDCFLFEGPKVLFRFTIALLGLYQDEILEHTDTISVMKVLKAAVRLTYDVDGLNKFAFDELNPFPSRAFLRQRQSLYLQVLQEQLYKRLQLRNFLDVTRTSDSDKVCDLPIELITFSHFDDGHGYVCAGNQKRGKLSLITFHAEAANLNTLEIEFDCRPVSMVIFHQEMAFVSLLSGYIVALHLHDNTAEILWELKLNDVALKLVHCESRLYSCLANGTLTVLENAFEKMPSALDLYHIPVSAAPITDALIDDENLYLAVACKIVILNRSTLSSMGSIYVASAAAGSNVPMFEKIRAFSHSPHGIWLITAHSSLIQLWKDSDCHLLFDITYDHSHRKPSFDEEDTMEHVEIYSIMFHDNEVWVGTVDGYLMLYRVIGLDEAGQQRANGNKGKLSRNLSLHKYPAGKRLSPIRNLSMEIPQHRQQMYYIPTKSEREVEESASSNEYPESERQTRKISVKIDKYTKKYSVDVQHLRQMSIDSANHDPSRIASSSSQSIGEWSRSTKARGARCNRRLCKENSVDSAVSVFSSSDVKDSSPPQRPEPDPMGIKPNEPLESNQARKAAKNESPILSMGGCSMEYDDYFEVYSESSEGDNRIPDPLGLIDGCQIQLRKKFSPTKLIQIPVRKMSEAAFGSPLAVEENEDTSFPDCLTNETEHEPIPNERKSSDLTFSNSAPNTTLALLKQPVSRSESFNEEKAGLKIRRKDLDFDDTLLVAVKERANSIILDYQPSTSESQNVVTVNPEEIIESEIKSSLSMILQMKLKIADKPVKCITLARFNDEDVIVTGAGNYGDEEAILRWHRDGKSGLWINDPLSDIGVRGRKRTTLSVNNNYNSTGFNNTSAPVRRK